MARKTKYDFYNDQFKATAVELGALPDPVMLFDFYDPLILQANHHLS